MNYLFMLILSFIAIELSSMGLTEYVHLGQY